MKIFMYILVLLSLNVGAKTMPTNEQNKELNKYQQVIGIKLGSNALISKDIILDKEDKEKNISFYKYKKTIVFYGVKPQDITLIAVNGKWSGAILEFENESNYNLLKKEFSKKFGQPIATAQDNNHLTSAWGIAYEKHLVRPVVINFDLYEQMGVVIWTDPKEELKFIKK